MRNAAVSSHVVSTAAMGGGLMNGGTAHLVNTTVAFNRADNRPYNGDGLAVGDIGAYEVAP